ncbi:transcription elongation GreA/GreB family factor [Sphingomonas sp. BE138]|uniref:hypothetical protein n=1 Tax=Sphingomonas sp. BE138 TaxID=2817845 RepID=UPI002866C31D|nr:hypothetical protein [Sphingomonas sp. BE138]MDR6787174.1 transcription elongation GreA/GreB family factor [Sphingomonas sp. BE138]
MSRAGDERRQATQLLRLRQVRLQAAARALADARTRADAAREAADRAADDATAAARAQAEAHAALAADPAEAERRLAVLDAALFRKSVTEQAKNAADAVRSALFSDEVAHRRATIIARARHDLLAERAATLRRRDRTRTDERQHLDREDTRRFK